MLDAKTELFGLISRIFGAHRKPANLVVQMAIDVEESEAKAKFRRALWPVGPSFPTLPKLPALADSE